MAGGGQAGQVIELPANGGLACPWTEELPAPISAGAARLANGKKRFTDWSRARPNEPATWSGGRERVAKRPPLQRERGESSQALQFDGGPADPPEEQSYDCPCATLVVVANTTPLRGAGPGLAPKRSGTNLGVRPGWSRWPNPVSGSDNRQDSL